MNRLWAIAGLLPLSSPFAASEEVARMVKIGGRPAVRIGGRALVWNGQWFLPPPLPPPVGVDAHATFREWLKDDARWGGRERAERLRLIETRGGGIAAYLSEAYSAPGRDAFAVMSLIHNMRSGSPAIRQILVRIPRGKGEIEWVRPLSDLPELLYEGPPKRVYRYGGNRYLLEADGLHAATSDGSLGKRIVELPIACAPHGVADGRYIVLGSGEFDSPVADILALDLKARRTFFVYRSIPGKKPDVQPYLDSTAIGNSPYLTFVGPAGRNRVQPYFTVHLPDLTRHSLPRPLQVLGEYGLEQRSDRLVVYRLISGRPVQTFPLPKRS